MAHNAGRAGANPFEDDLEKQAGWGSADGGRGSRSNLAASHGAYMPTQEFVKSNTMLSEKGYANQTAFSMGQGKTQRELELDAREAQLNVREAERRMEGSGYKPPNWPPFRPILYHDIDAEIPALGKPIVTRLYQAWWLSLAAFTVNVIGNLCLLITKQPGAGMSFGLSILFFFIGPAFSFVFWYRNAYNGTRHNNSLQYVLFFFNYGIFIAASIIFTLGLQSSGGCGFMNGADALTQNTGAGIVCMLCATLWLVQVLFGIYNFKATITFYRGAGMTVEQAKGQAVREAAKASI